MFVHYAFAYGDPWGSSAAIRPAIPISRINMLLVILGISVAEALYFEDQIGFPFTSIWIAGLKTDVRQLHCESDVGITFR